LKKIKDLKQPSLDRFFSSFLATTSEACCHDWRTSGRLSQQHGAESLEKLGLNGNIP